MQDSNSSRGQLPRTDRRCRDKRWSNNGYGAEIAKDIPPDTKIKDLSAAQMRPLMAAMREREGWNAKPAGGARRRQPQLTRVLPNWRRRLPTQNARRKACVTLGNESLSTRLNDNANRLTAEKNRLIEESRRQQERAKRYPRAVAKTDG